MKLTSQRLAAVKPSQTLVIHDRAKALQAAGHDIVVMAGGEPDFDTPPHIVAAGITAIQAGDTHYPTPTKGTQPLLEAIADKMARENGIHVNPATDIVTTPGSKWALFIALAALLNPSDEVIYLEPAWVSYPAMIHLNGGVPVPVALPAETNFAVTRALLQAALTERTKAVMVNSPCNPSGRVLTPAEVQIIADFVKEHDLYLITDEVYEYLIFDDHAHHSPAAEPDMAERTLTTNGFSKGYAMTGWRLGWVAGPTDLMKKVVLMHNQAVTAAASFVMAAGVVALQGPKEPLEAMRQAYLKRRNFMVNALNEMAGIECPMPEGTFYVMPRFTQTSMDSVQLAQYLLDEAGIAGTPGIAFGQSTENHIRFSIATAMPELEKAVERLAQTLPTLNGG